MLAVDMMGTGKGEAAGGREASFQQRSHGHEDLTGESHRCGGVMGSETHCWDGEGSVTLSEQCFRGPGAAGWQSCEERPAWGCLGLSCWQGGTAGMSIFMQHCEAL